MEWEGNKKGGSDIELEICNGPFKDWSSRSGWIGPAGTIHTANSGTQTLMTWTKLGGSGVNTSPDCITDVQIYVDYGMLYDYLRRFRAYYWLDTRILVGGAVVATYTIDQYLYKDNRDATPVTGNAPLLLEMEEFGTSTFTRANVPANSVVEVEIQVRYNYNAAQDQAYGRIIRQGLRSTVNTDFSPKTIVTGVVA